LLLLAVTQSALQSSGMKWNLPTEIKTNNCNSESAGGASVDFYSYAWTKDPIVSSMIAESGSVSSFADPQPKNNVKFWDIAAKTLKCPTATDNAKSSVECIRGKNTEEVLEAAKTENPLQGVLGHFGPTVDNKVVFGDYAARSAAGNFIQKPFMNGNNDWEAGLFVLIAEGAKIKIPARVWDVFNAAVFTCPIQRAANARTNNKVMNYRYRYFGDFPNTYLQSNNRGAWHTAEISQIFGTTESVTAMPNTPSETKLSTFMQKAWTSFAKDPASLQKAPFNFPQYNSQDANAPTLIAFGASPNETHQLLAPFQWDLYCDPITSLTNTIPGGIAAAIENVANGGDLGVPGLTVAELPDMKPAPLWTYSADA
jgi:cholinesterase